MSATDDLLLAFETHSPKGIRDALRAGASPVGAIAGKSPMNSLIEMYTRSSRFPECVQIMLDAGATVDNALLQAILLDDPLQLGKDLRPDYRLNLNCTFTSLRGVRPLHVCAEYNSLKCATALLEAGADVNQPADLDGQGFNGHTPLFHTVNSNRNFARPMMELLCDAGAEVNVRVRALLWGRGFEWETTIFDVTPISYAQCGLYFQFHRREQNVYDNIAYLYARRYGVSPIVRNVPNKYLNDKRVFPPRM